MKRGITLELQKELERKSTKYREAFILQMLIKDKCLGAILCLKLRCRWGFLLEK